MTYSAPASALVKEKSIALLEALAVAQSGDFYKVLVGAEASESAAQNLVASLRRERISGSVVALP